MANKLFGTKDRAASHQKLEEILAEGLHPLASCRENPNDPDEPYQVWDGGPDAFVLPPAPEPPKTAEISDRDLDRLAEKLGQYLEKKGKP